MQNAILPTFIQQPFVIMIFVMSIFEWQLKTGFINKLSAFVICWNASAAFLTVWNKIRLLTAFLEEKVYILTIFYSLMDMFFHIQCQILVFQIYKDNPQSSVHTYSEQTKNKTNLSEYYWLPQYINVFFFFFFFFFFKKRPNFVLNQGG